jgi:hypothetical protein
MPEGSIFNPLLLRSCKNMLKLTTKKTKWFPVPQDPTGETQIEVKHLKPGEVADIEAKTNRVTGKQSEGEDFMTEIDFNLNARRKKYVIASVVAWKGFVGTNEKNLPCNDPNKLEVLNEFEWFGDFVEECREELAAEVEEEMEGADPN